MNPKKANRISEEIETAKEFLNGNHKEAAPEMPVYGMRELVQAKLKQAEEQATLWQRNLAAAQEQVIRWSAVAQTCRELLAETEEQEIEGTEERAGPGS